MLRWLLGLILLVLLGCGALFFLAGRVAAPVITFEQPQRRVGQKGDVQLAVGVEGGKLAALTLALEQGGQALPLFSLDAPQTGILSQPAADTVRLTRPFGKTAVPELKEGPARLIATATRTSFLNLRTKTTTVAHDIDVSLQPPRIAVVSMHHYINHGGSEMVVYRATPPDVVSGVKVGDLEYPGFPAAGAGLGNGDPALKVAVFALLHDQDLKTPITAFARDDAGNVAETSFIDNVFPKPFRRSRIEVDGRFFSRVVPEILEHSPEVQGSGDLLTDFLTINGKLRQLNADRIRELTAPTSSVMLWKGPFVQLGNSQVEASFADHRTYVHEKKDIDQQVHLGFDLAVTARVPIAAANDGVVVNASWLGIYGNCVIVDHGLGVASLYGHLSSMDVKVGDRVTKGQILGRSGLTGLAGGDHLHYTTLVGGRPVNPVEWWDPHWMADRVERKLREAGAPAAP